MTAHVSAHMEDLGWQSVETAPSVICSVRDGDVEGLGKLLDKLDRQQLYALVVALAAAFEPERVRFRAAVAWVDLEPPERAPMPPGRRRLLPDELVQPHGTHAAFMRHKNRGEQPCQDCVEGERIYQHNRHLRRTGRAVAC